jgi:hypothetical protein
MGNAPIYGAWKTKKSGNVFALKPGATKWPLAEVHFKIFWAKTCNKCILKETSRNTPAVPYLYPTAKRGL